MVCSVDGMHSVSGGMAMVMGWFGLQFSLFVTFSCLHMGVIYSTGMVHNIVPLSQVQTNEFCGHETITWSSLMSYWRGMLTTVVYASLASGSNSLK
jgi:hypothetical protein